MEFYSSAVTGNVDPWLGVKIIPSAPYPQRDHVIGVGDNSRKQRIITKSSHYCSQLLGGR